MYSELLKLAQSYNVPRAEMLSAALTAAVILLLGALLFMVLNRRIVPILVRLINRTPTEWDNICVKHGVLHYATWLIAGVFVNTLAQAWLQAAPTWLQALSLAAHLGVLLAAVFVIGAFLDAANEIYNRYSFARQFPIRVLIQLVKILIILVAVIMALSLILNRSLTLLVSGLGAMTAVLMLVFKDPILGFVAGIQLTANRMLAVGDWLEMPKYNADGDVIDIGLTTVKVCNWDRTITTIPSYALISDSFINWRGMTESGGRRIKRSIYIDVSSVHFLKAEQINRLRRLQLLSQYIEEKVTDIEAYNREHNLDASSPANGRHLTNLGTFRAYLVAYLRRHSQLRQDMIMIVRQLQPTAQGLPIEVYAFTNDTRWVQYEGIQSDIFDHILAVVPEFDLRVFQSPTGVDLRESVKAANCFGSLSP